MSKVEKIETDERYKKIKELDPKDKKLVLMYLEALLASVLKK